MSNEELVLAIRAGDDVTANMEQLYNQNTGMIRKVVKKFAGIEEIDDLMQEAYFGLARAVNLWNPEREASFLTFAIVCIKSVLYRYITDCGALIRIPENQKTLIYKYNKIMLVYRSELGRDATPDELQILLDLSKVQFEQLKKDRLALRIRSTSEPIGGENEDMILEDVIPADGDPIGDAIDRIQQEELSRTLWAEVDKLPDRERAVIRDKYQRGQTYIQCGESLGISSERVRQLHERALRTLRRPKVTKRLVPYLTESAAFGFGARSGLASFRNSHTTGQERAVMKLEEWAGAIWHKPVMQIEDEQRFRWP